MNFFKKVRCRVYQSALYVGMAFMPWRQPELCIGENSFEQSVDLLVKNGVDRPLLVCSKGALKRRSFDGFFDKAKGILNYVVYDGVMPNPTVQQVEQGLTLYKQNDCNGILAFGGGSSMDCAKAIGARVVCPNKSVNQMKGLLKVRKKLPPFFAVPTTAGTGSECTVAAVITDEQTCDKYAINDFALIPHFAILDPLLTKDLPPFLTATTGMDALTHAVEAYIGRANTHLTKKQAEQAVKLIFDNLETATHGGDLQSRQNMQRAAYLAGLAFTRAYVGYVHAMAHALGGTYGTAHGLANAVLLPVVLKSFGKPAEKPLARLAVIVGVASDVDDRHTAATKFIDAIFALNKRLELPDRLTDIKEDDIAVLSAHADKEANPLYPVPRLMDAQDFARIYRQVM